MANFITERTNQSKADIFGKVLSQNKELYKLCVDAVAFTAANSVSINYLLGIMDGLKTANDNWNAAGVEPGILAYVRNRLGDQAWVATDFTASQTAVNVALAWINDTVPKSADGYVKNLRIDATGTRTVPSYTPAQTAIFRTYLQNIVNTFA